MCSLLLQMLKAHNSAGLATHLSQYWVDTPNIVQGQQYLYERLFLLQPPIPRMVKSFNFLAGNFRLVYVTLVWKGKATTVGRWSIGHQETLLVVSYSPRLARLVFLSQQYTDHFFPFEPTNKILLIFMRTIAYPWNIMCLLLFGRPYTNFSWVVNSFYLKKLSVFLQVGWLFVWPG